MEENVTHLIPQLNNEITHMLRRKEVIREKSQQIIKCYKGYTFMKFIAFRIHL